MKIIKILKIIILTVLLVLITYLSSNNNYTSIDINNGNIVLPKTTKFSLSLWVKPIDNSYYNSILKLSDDSSAIYILNNSEDENFKSTGITMSTDVGNIYKNNNYKLDVGIWSNITLCINGNYLDLYLDGNKAFSGLMNNSLKNGDINLKVFDEFQFDNIKYYDYSLSDNEIKRCFENNIDYKFRSIQNNNNYPSNAGNYQLSNVPFKVEYISQSDDLFFNAHSFTLKENNEKNDRTLKYIAIITIGDKKYQQELHITQKGNNENNYFNSLVQSVKNGFNYYMSTSDKLEFNNDIKVTCKVIKGHASYDNIKQMFVKTEGAKEKEPISIECIVEYDDKKESFTKDIILLDDYKGYLMVFFNGEDGWPMHLTGDETLYFAYSDDLKQWKILTNKQTIYTNKGTGRFRDPYINRDKEGNFVITSTQGYYNPGIYITKSKDLSSFETTIAEFNKYDSLLGLKGNTTWAPEYFYNQEKDIYTIIFSEGNQDNKGIYAVDTKDFNEFSYPYLYLYTGYNSIDANITVINGKYYLLFKDERENNKNVYYATATNINSPLWNMNNDYALNGDLTSEGPFVIKNFENNKYHLYLDGFKLSTIYSGELNTNDDKLSVDLSKDFALENVPSRIRHFSIIPITKKEYNNFINLNK